MGLFVSADVDELADPVAAIQYVTLARMDHVRSKERV